MFLTLLCDNTCHVKGNPLIYVNGRPLETDEVLKVQDSVTLLGSNKNIILLTLSIALKISSNVVGPISKYSYKLTVENTEIESTSQPMYCEDSSEHDTIHFNADTQAMCTDKKKEIPAVEASPLQLLISLQSCIGRFERLLVATSFLNILSFISAFLVS